MHLFDTDTAVAREAPDTYAGELSGNWSIANVPNGGYILAAVARAAGMAAEKNQTPIFTLNYVYRCEPGPFTVRSELMARSRQYDRLSLSLAQKGAERVRAFATFRAQDGPCPEKRYEQGPPELAPVEECPAIPSMPAYSLYDQVEVRLDPSCAGWMMGSPGESSEMKGWFRFREPRAADLFSLALALDAFPPAVMASQGMLPWVPTIELSVNVRNEPASEWLACVFRSRFLDCGIVEEDGQVWDREGRLCALSRQIAQVRTEA